MKRSFSPGLEQFRRFSIGNRLAIAVAGSLAFLSLPPVRAADILWQATASGAWITGANWAGGVMPWSGDVAQFGNAGPGSIGVALWHPSYTPKGEGRVGAISLLESRVDRDLLISGNVNSSSTFYLEGATLHGIGDTVLLNESGRNLTIAPSTSSYSRSMSIALRENADHVIQVRGAGNVTLQSAVTGSLSRLSIRGTGTGSVILEGTGSTYSGGTTLYAGTLIVAANGAAGTGAVANEGGTLQVNAGVTFANAVTLAAPEAVYRRLYAGEQSYGGYGATGDLGAPDGVGVAFAILEGEATQERTLSAGFESLSLAVNDGDRRSDILELSGTGDDIFVLELRLTDGEVRAGDFLAWLDGDRWVNAIENNSAVGSDAVLGFNGSFTLSGAAADAGYLGSWGYDPANQSVWAVLDHNSSFAIVPEPASFILLGLGALAVLCRRKRAAR